MSVPTYGLGEIKKEIQHLPQSELAELCLRLVRYKKENKELLAYLLFEASNEAAFVEKVKADVGFMFSQLPYQAYAATKSIRKILRLIGKYTKFMASKTAEIDLLVNFCYNYVQYADKKAASYKPMRPILTRQLEKIKTAIDKLHEDLQYDFMEEFNQLQAAAKQKFPWL
jgi:hypothetical protein